MSRTPYFYMETYNPKDGTFKRCEPFVWNYQKTKLVRADLWTQNASYELFDVLENDDIDTIQYGMPQDSDEEIQRVYREINKDCSLTVKWIWLRDLEFCRTNWYKKNIRRAISGLLNRAESFIEVTEDFDTEIVKSNTRIIFWII